VLQKLLQYAETRIDPEARWESVNVDSVLETVKSNLNSLVEETDADLMWHQMPVISGYSVRLICLFQNLIGNAITIAGVCVLAFGFLRNGTPLFGLSPWKTTESGSNPLM